MQKKHDAIRQPKQIICPGRAREKLEEENVNIGVVYTYHKTLTDR